PMGTGAYACSYDGGGITLTRRPDAAGHASAEDVYIKEVKVVASEKGYCNIVDFNKGNVRVGIVENGVYYVDRTDVSFTELYSPNYEFIAYNTASGVFAKKEMRQAVSYLIDRKAFFDESVLSVSLTEAFFPIIPGCWAYDEVRDPYEFTQESIGLARGLISESGYVMWNDVYGTNVGGALRPLVIRIIVNKGSKLRYNRAEDIMGQLGGLGLTCVIDYLDWDAYLTRARSGDYDIAMAGVSLPKDPDVAFMFSSDPAFADTNIASYHNPEVDALLAEMSTDPSLRRANLALIRDIAYEDVPYLGVSFKREYLALSSAVKGQIRTEPWDVIFGLSGVYIPIS
ncbi:MAG: ABC transporter substrate-binding protein, partial [Oscillospiraceae bacterium]|nr:ABC transporter substrate-binding protein [Oscillospiraceae bacterium]